VNALVLLLAAAGSAFGWQLFADKPRAGMALAYVLGLVMAAIIKGGVVGRLMGLVCTWLLWAQASGLACVLAYERLASKDVGVCDEGTGLPVSLVLCVGLLVVAAEFLQQQKASRS
jgi:hypothetical protein